MSLCVSVWMCVNYEHERIQVSMWECVRNVCYEYVTAHVFLHIHLWLHLPACSGTRMGCKCHMCDVALSCSSLFTLFLWVPLCEVEKDQGSVLVISLFMSPGKCLHLLWPEQPGCARLYSKSELVFMVCCQEANLTAQMTPTEPVGWGLSVEDRDRWATSRDQPSHQSRDSPSLKPRAPCFTQQQPKGSHSSPPSALGNESFKIPLSFWNLLNSPMSCEHVSQGRI